MSRPKKNVKTFKEEYGQENSEPKIDTEPELDEKEVKEKVKRRRRKKKSLELPPEQLALIAPMITMPFDFLFVRIGSEKLSAEEKDNLGGAALSVLNKYIPSIMTSYGEEIAFGLCLIGIFGARWSDIKTYRGRLAEVKAEAPKAEAPKAEAPKADYNPAPDIKINLLEAEYPTIKNEVKIVKDDNGK